MPYAIRTYVGSDDWGNKKYLAHMNLGSDCYMSFFGSSTEEAEAKARGWYTEQRERYKTLDVTIEDEKPDTNFKSSWDTPKPDHGMVGKVWMINHKEKKRARVSADEVDTYIGMGYERGGPKSNFK